MELLLLLALIAVVCFLAHTAVSMNRLIASANQDFEELKAAIAVFGAAVADSKEKTQELEELLNKHKKGDKV